MKNVLIILIIFFIKSTSYGQCPSQFTILSTQEEIDDFSQNFPNCTDLAYDLRVDGTSNQITNLNGLSSIITSKNILILYTQIASLEGLNALESAEIFTLWGNQNINTLEGLGALNSMNSFQLYENNNLVGLDGMDSIQSINEIIFFENINLEDISSLSIITSLQSLILSGNTLTDLNGLQNLVTIENNLQISRENLLNINELSNIESIGGSLILTNNFYLQDISVFENIEILLDLYIVNCTSLISLKGLERLSTVMGELRIGFNSEITNLSHLKNIVSVDYLDIYENENLTTLQGIESIKYIEKRLFIDSNINLTSIKALKYLEFPSEIDEVIIINNTNLEICNNDFICAIADDPNVEKVFFNNATGCATIEEVEESCSLNFDDSSLDDLIIMYPNPISDNVNLSIVDDVNFIKTQIYSTLGMLVFESTDKKMNLSMLDSGSYTAKLTTNKGVFFKKIIKE